MAQMHNVFDQEIEQEIEYVVDQTDVSDHLDHPHALGMSNNMARGNVTLSAGHAQSMFDADSKAAAYIPGVQGSDFAPRAQFGGEQRGMNTGQMALSNKAHAPKLDMEMTGKGRGKKTIRKLKSEEDVANAVAMFTGRLSVGLIRKKGSFNVVLSGGTLIHTLRKLAQSPFAYAVDWSKWQVFWVDERVVPLDDPQSNYKCAYDEILSKVPIPEANIHHINFNSSARRVAQDYENSLKDLTRKKVLPLTQWGFPKFDLMLLGIGPDGHVASLFPHHPQLYERKKWVTYLTNSPKPPPERITFSFPVINSSSEIVVVATGLELADVVKQVLRKNNNHLWHQRLPIEMVSAEDEQTWFLDKDAASKL